MKKSKPYRVLGNALFIIPGLVLHGLFWFAVLRPFVFFPNPGLKTFDTPQLVLETMQESYSGLIQAQDSRKGSGQLLMEFKHDRSQSIFDLLKLSTKPNTPGPEFMGLYIAARQLVSGKSIYDRPDKLFPDRPEILVTTSNYPVTTALIVAPLLMLPPWTAYLIWLVVHEIALVLLIIFTLKFLKGLPYRWIFAGSWLYTSSYYEDLFMGQTSVFMALCIMLMGIALVERKKKLLAASWVTAIWIKLFPILWLPIIFRHLTWKQLIIAVLIVVIPISAYFIIHSDDMSFFLLRLTGTINPADSSELMPEKSKTSVAGGEGLQRLIWNWFRSEKLVTTLSIGIMLIALVVAVSAKSSNSLLQIALLVHTHFLAFPYVWFHHYLMLLPAIVFLYYCMPNPWIIVPILFIVISPSRWFFPDLSPYWNLWWILPTAILFCILLIKNASQIKNRFSSVVD
ncbi:MAG: glycosyltransferase family 87 protein [bacterium]